MNPVVDLVKCCDGRSVLSESVLVLWEVDVVGDGGQGDFFQAFLLGVPVGLGGR